MFVMIISVTPGIFEQRGPTFFCATDQFNVRPYSQGPAVKMWGINTTKEHDMTVVKTVVFSKSDNKRMSK